MSQRRYKFGERAYAYSLVPTLRVGTSVGTLCVRSVAEAGRCVPGEVRDESKSLQVR